MAEEIVTGVAAKAAESLISQTWQEIQCLLNYKSNIKKLKEKVEYLEVRKNTIQRSIDEATNNGEDIGPDVLDWMNKVGNIQQEVNKFLEHARNNTQWGCLCCKCPKPHSRYKLSKQALEWTTEVIGLQDASKFERIGYQTQPGQMPFISPGEFDSFESRMMILNDVMEALRDHSTTITGICGMGGIGKTTLVKEIADKVKVVNLFDEVAMAVVSNDVVVENVQRQLAECLGLKFEETTDRGRAERLYKRLLSKDKRVLVILDDIWEEFDLQNIGIPVDGNSDRLKVLLTSRSKEVCCNMRAKTFEVEVLSREESLNLFKMAAEISGAANDIKDIAEEVAKECGGLPLAIVTVGKALKNKEIYVWKNALQQLKQASVTTIRGMNKLVYSRIRLSYDYLENDHSKKLLLLCSLFPEDYNIELECLVRYAKGLQFLKNVNTVAQVRDEVYSIVDELKNCYLLLVDDNNEKRVRLHDIVRDVCLQITSSGDPMHTIKHDGLMEWPSGYSYASSTAISLSFGKIDQILSTLEYPKLELLSLSFKEHKLQMQEDFFEKMKEIKVLRINNLNSKLPSSLESLVNLQTLCLDHCKLCGDLSVIESQKKLEILSLYNSYLEHFPNKISELNNLKSLDLRFKKGPPLPSGILVKLGKLEELYLASYFEEWKRKGEDAYSVIITEISTLLNLQTIRFCAYDSRCFEQVLEKLRYPEKLMTFRITITRYNRGAGGYQLGKVLMLDRINVDLLKKNATQCLLKKTEDLRLSNVKGLTNLVGELDTKGFVNLKTLYLERCCDLRYLVDANSFHTRGGGAFINLEELELTVAENLEELCRGNLPVGSFARLRKLNLYHLPSLRSCGLMRNLLQLQEIVIRDCPILETIVSNKEDETDSRDHVEFPKLRSLELYHVESFRSIVPESPSGALLEKVMLPNLEKLSISYVNVIRCVVDEPMLIGSLSKLQSIRIRYCDDFVHLAASADSMKHFHNLQQLEVLVCKSIEVVFDFSGSVESLQSLLPRLEMLRLHALPKLKHIYRMLPEGFHVCRNLKSLYVFTCGSLRHLLSPSMAQMLVSLETLYVYACDQMEAIIGVDEKESKEIESTEQHIVMKKDGLENTNKLEFPKLKKIHVQKLPNFRMLCFVNVELELTLLTKVIISECPNMTKFCDGRIIAKSLDNVNVSFTVDGGFVNNEKEVVLDEFSSWLKDCESRIRCIKCSFYEIESCDHLG